MMGLGAEECRMEKVRLWFASLLSFADVVSEDRCHGILRGLFGPKRTTTAMSVSFRDCPPPSRRRTLACNKSWE